MPNTTITTRPPTPVNGQSLEIDCSSVVPTNVQGTVTVTLRGPDGSIVAQSQGMNGAMAVFSIPNASPSDAGEYQCNVQVVSLFFASSDDNPRPLEDTETLPVTVPGELIMTASVMHTIFLLFSCFDRGR